MTIEAAYSGRKESELGSITPGKIANFTVLEKDPLGVPAIELENVPVWGTVFEGRVFQVPQELRRQPYTRREAPIAAAAPTRERHRAHDHGHGADSCGLARELLGAMGEALQGKRETRPKRPTKGASARR